MPRTPPYPPYPPFPPFAPFPPVAPFPPYPPYPANPCAPCATPGPPTDGGAPEVPSGPAPSPEDAIPTPPKPPEKEPDPDPDKPVPDVPGGRDPHGGNGAPPPPPDPGDGSAEKPIIPDRISVRRPDDLLLFDASFTGYFLRKDPTRLERSSADAFIVFEFPPQSFGEEAFLEVAGQSFEKKPSLDEQTEVSNDPHYPKKNVADTSDETPAHALPLSRVRMARPSRIAVTMPAELTTIGYDLASLLAALRDWPMRLDANAVSDRLFDLATLVQTTHAAGLDNLSISAEAMPTHAELSVFATALHGTSAADSSTEAALVTDLAGLRLKQTPKEPASTVTALELPYRVVTSPLAPARWRHAIAPVTRRAHTELWHTRLGDNTSEAGADAATRIRALWSPDYRPKDKQNELIDILNAPPPLAVPPKPNPNLIRMSLDPLDRSMLVTAMSGFDESLKGGADYHPLSSEAKRLHLSALGALLDAEGTWPKTPEHIDLQQWRHVATLGRDQYVRVLYAGYLWPFGHAASLIKVTERKFESLDGKRTQRVALLRQRFFIAVREPVRTYSGANHKFQGRNFPFTRIELLTRVTPDLSEPGVGDSAPQPGVPGLVARMLFWPMVPAGAKLADVAFEIAATDIAGLSTSFSMPLLFVGKLAEAKKTDVCNSYNATLAVPRRRAAIGGAIVTYAPPDPADKGDPKLPTQTITFAAAELPDAIDPSVYPEIECRRSRHQADPEAARPTRFHHRGCLSRVLQVARLRRFAEQGAGLSQADESEGPALRRLADGSEKRLAGRAGDAEDESARPVEDPRAGVRRRLPPLRRSSKPAWIRSKAEHSIPRAFSRTRRCSAASSCRRSCRAPTT